MTKYIEPEFKVVKIKTQDVITTSGISDASSQGYETGNSNVPIINL